MDLRVYIHLSIEDYRRNGECYLRALHEVVKYAVMHDVELFYFEEQFAQVADEANGDNSHATSVGDMLELIMQYATPAPPFPRLFRLYVDNDFPSMCELPTTGITAHSNVSVICQNECPFTDHLLHVHDSKVELIKLERHNSFKQLMNCITNAAPRPFHITGKHGENGRGNWRGESVLECSCAQAQSLINEAVPSKIKQRNLYNYDAERKLFVEFYYEGDNPQHLWHGFHVKREHENRQIPNDIKLFFANKRE